MIHRQRKQTVIEAIVRLNNLYGKGTVVHVPLNQEGGDQSGIVTCFLQYGVSKARFRV